MRVTAEEGARCGTIEYPSLRCGGYLVNCHRRGDVVTWTEVYTHNPGTCAPAGRRLAPMRRTSAAARIAGLVGR